MRGKLFFVFVLMIVLMVLGACGDDNSNNTSTANDSEPEDIKELVHDYSVGDFSDVQASITSTQLIVTDSNQEQATHDLPEDEFFVSVAPFIDQTHPCKDHSLTGCQGELINKEIDVLIEDQDGNAIVDETMTTPENGFLDFWLPRDEQFDVTFSYDNKSVKSEISTFDDDDTCVTNLQMT